MGRAVYFDIRGMRLCGSFPLPLPDGGGAAVCVLGGFRFLRAGINVLVGGGRLTLRESSK